jgi:signal transduction histidine kinase
MMGTLSVGAVLVAASVTAVAAVRARRGARVLRAEVAQLTTQLEASRRLLGKSDRLSAIGMLAASVAHEIRNPLVSVRTFVQLAPERLHDEEFRTGFRNLALGEVDRICLLVNDLLAFARPTAPEAHATDINDILGQIRRLVEGEAKKGRVELSSNLAPSLPMVEGDEARIKQVFLNVVLNAIQACAGGGTVSVATSTVCRDDNRYLQVEVRDSGVGIEPEAVEHIFDPFFTTKERGSGLGLFIARQILRDHQGEIEVASTPGAGTTLLLRFPVPAELPVNATAGGVSKDANDSPHRSVANG